MPTYIGQAKLHNALVNRWANGGLSTLFESYWAEDAIGEYTVLNDGEAGPNQPWPYCVYVLSESKPTIRMTGPENQNWEVRDTSLEFHIFALAIGSEGAKEVAARLAERVMARFGGHPTEHPAPVEVVGGDILIMKFMGEFGVRAEKSGSEEEWKWIVKYQIRQDVQSASY